MKSKILVALLFSVLATPGSASSVFENLLGPSLQLAQLSPEERRLLRERWERADPEERMDMRQQLQERMQRRAPESWRQGQQYRRETWAGQRPYPPAAGDAPPAVSNFGTGFERRRPGYGRQGEDAPDFDPRNRFGSGERDRR